MSKIAFSQNCADTLRARLLSGGLRPHNVEAVLGLPRRELSLESRRPHREEGGARGEAMFVCDGLVSLFKAYGPEQRRIVALRFPGDGIVPGVGGLDYGIQAVTPSRVIIWEAEHFNLFANRNLEFQRFIRGTVERHASIALQWLVNIGSGDSISRVAHLLCETVIRSGENDNPESFVNPLTQKQVGEATGQTHVNVNRVLGDLERAGLIERQGRGSIIVRDWSELKRLARFDDDYLRLVNS